MDNYTKIYWLTRLDNIQSFLSIVLFISLIFLFFYYLAMFINCFDSDDRAEYSKDWGKYRNISFWTALIFGIVLIFMPSKNDLILIYAGGKTMDFVNTDTSIAKIPSQTTLIISEYLDKSIQEIRK